MADKEKYCLNNRIRVLWTDRVLGYALADGFIKQLVKGTYKLTEKGKKFVKKIKLDKEVMSNEIEFLERIGNRLSEEKYLN